MGVALDEDLFYVPLDVLAERESNRLACGLEVWATECLPERPNPMRR